MASLYEVKKHEVETRSSQAVGSPGDKATSEEAYVPIGAEAAPALSDGSIASAPFRRSRQTNNLFLALLVLAGIVMIVALAFGTTSTSATDGQQPTVSTVPDTELPPPAVFVQTD